MVESKAWRAHVGFIAWPTLVFFAVVTMAYTLVSWAAWTGRLPLGFALALNTILAYASFTPVHEAAHGNVFGAGAGVRESAVGWVSAALLGKPFSLFRRMHLQHHSHTNDPVLDPDHWVASSSLPALLFRCLTIYPRYFRVAFRKGTLEIQDVVTALGFAIPTWVLTVAGIAAGVGPQVLCIHVVPAWWALALLALSLDWAPHHPHSGRGRYKDTRVILGPGLDVLMMGHNLHLIHHLWTRVPWYRYRAVFREVEGEMDARGVEVVRWPRSPVGR